MSGITSIPHCGELEDGAGVRGPRDPSSGGLNDVIRCNMLTHVSLLSAIKVKTSSELVFRVKRLFDHVLV